MSIEFMLTVQPDPSALAFVLGAQSYRVSIHTQQIRALKLASQLAGDDDFTKAKNAAVIGAGAAGMTLALALAAQGKTVSLFEKSSRLIPLQYNNGTRYIHPFSVNWPAHPFSPSSNIPLMNWYADYSSSVAKKLYEKYIGLKGSLKLDITEHKSSRVRSCRRSEHGAGFELQWDGSGVGSFDSVFFTDGFGFERKLSPFDNFSYWEDSSVLPGRCANTTRRLAVIGDGDGALIDIARCVYQTKDLERIYDYITRNLANPAFRRWLTRIECELSLDSTEDLPNGYIQRFSSAVCRPEVDNYLSKFEEHDCVITHISDSQEGISPRSSPINKFLYLFLRLKRPHKVHFVRARAASVKEIKSLSNETYEFRVIPSRSPPYNKRAYLHQKPIGRFDRVLERLGPSSYGRHLVDGIFSEVVFNTFLKRNANQLDFANPTSVSSEELLILRNMFDEATWASEGSNDLIEYVNLIIGAEIDKAASPHIGFDLDSDRFEINGVILPEIIEPWEIAGKGGRSRIDYLPKTWYGRKVKIGRFTRGNLRKDRDAYRVVGNAHFGAEVSEPLKDFMSANQRVQLCSSDLPNPPDGRIAYFVKRREIGESAESIYGVTPRHVIQSTFKSTDVCALGSGGASRKIGEVEIDLFQDRILAETRNGTFSCLGDVAFIRIDETSKTKNEIDGLTLSNAVSVFDAAKRGCKAFNGKEHIGRITKVFNHTSIALPLGDPIPVETFVIECDGSVNPKTIISGTLVHTEDGNILGMVIGSDRDSLYCLESFKVHSKLDLVLA